MPAEEDVRIRDVCLHRNSEENSCKGKPTFHKRCTGPCEALQGEVEAE